MSALGGGFNGSLQHRVQSIGGSLRVVAALSNGDISALTLARTEADLRLGVNSYLSFRF
jgi:hypothetical protein